MYVDSLSRRKFLTITAAGLTAIPLSGRVAFAQTGSLVWVGYGGSTQDAQRVAFVDPFTKDTGINVTAAAGPDLAKLQAQVQTGNMEWDVLSVIGSQAIRAGASGLLEAIDYNVVDKEGLEVEPLEYCAPYYAYGGGIAYDPKRNPNPPTTWKEFWDVDTFPGRRGLRNRPDENLEIALMADGVPAKELYPLDVDRAFASLDRIKPHVSHWIPQTPETISLLARNEIDYVFTYSGRVEAAQKDGQSIAYVYENNVVTAAYLAVAKGSANRDAAMRLVSYFLKPELQAAYCDEMGYAPTKAAARELMSPEVLARQPDLAAPGTAVTDNTWWAEHGDAVTTRFKSWLLS